MAIDLDRLPLNKSSEYLRLHLVFGGRCQGVGFRYTAASIAERLGLTGWVKNHMDGSVEMEIQGTALGIRRFLTKLQAAYTRYRFDFYITSSRQDPTLEGEKGFRVRY